MGGEGSRSARIIRSGRGVSNDPPTFYLKHPLLEQVWRRRYRAAMPELPDIIVYLERLQPRVQNQVLESVPLASPFLLPTVDPPIFDVEGRPVNDLFRIGKRIVFAFDGDLFLVLHLMIAGRLHWKPRGAKVPGKVGLAAFTFSTGTLVLTEAGTKKRGSLHLVKGRAGLDALDPGGLEVLDADLLAFRARLLQENHTLKRALTDPHLFSGIGNAYSDEILHAARLSPLTLTHALSEEELARLYDATRATLRLWIDHLRKDVKDGFPEKVTAFRPEMAVHGRFKKPCPVCGAPVQHIVYADNECNYCATCQTGGGLAPDRPLFL